jgi:mannitol/fructose-specific phosphotransferase system IIA component (Ntr-type)
MDTNTIREAVLRRSFKSFTLRMNDGRRFYIPHPEYVAVSRRVVLVIDSQTEAGVYLEPILVSSLQYEDGEPSANGEGGKA